MAHRVFATATIVSAVLLGVTVCLLLVAGNYAPVFPHEHLVSITRDWHVTVSRGRLVFFNNMDFGPYLGSVISITDDKGVAHPPVEKTGFGDAWGVYYRHLRWLDSGEIVWTAAISFVHPLLIFAILPVIWTWRRLSTAAPGRGDSLPSRNRMKDTFIRMRTPPTGWRSRVRPT